MDLEQQAPFLANYGPVVLAVVTLVISLYVLFSRATSRQERHEEKLRRIDEDNYIMQDTAGIVYAAHTHITHTHTPKSSICGSRDTAGVHPQGSHSFVSHTNFTKRRCIRSPPPYKVGAPTGNPGSATVYTVSVCVCVRVCVKRP